MVEAGSPVGMATGGHIAGAALVRIIPQWAAYDWMQVGMNGADIRSLFGIHRPNEAEALQDHIGIGQTKPVEYEVRGFRVVLAVQVSEGTLRVFKPAMLATPRDLVKFMNEYATLHGCKVVYWHSAPMRSEL